jgi:hypothetical protein
VASRIEIYSLYQAAETNLLVRVTRRDSNNADESDCSAAIAEAYHARQQVLEFALRSPPELLGSSPVLAGEFQDIPVGEALFDATDGSTIDIWYARSGYGEPWVVLGTAQDEPTFWRELEDYEELMSHNPLRPAVPLRVHHYTDGVLER